MVEGITIRVVEANDEQAMSEIARVDALVRSSAWSASSWCATLSSPSAALVAYEGERAVGFSCFGAVYEEGELLMVAVDPAYQGRGIARQLLREGESQIRWHGVTKIHLEVASKNSVAIALYHKLGYEVVGRRKAYYPDGDDAVLMTLFFAICAG